MARLWTALLLLAAVFAVHGSQCASAGAAGGHEHTSLAPAASVGVLAAAVHGDAVPGAVPDHRQVAAGHGTAGASAGSVTGPPAPWHDGHVLAVCLAVVFAGLTVLGVLARLRGTRIALVRGSPGPGRWSTGWSRPPRPPDLSVLCLLRI